MYDATDADVPLNGGYFVPERESGFFVPDAGLHAFPHAYRTPGMMPRWALNPVVDAMLRALMWLGFWDLCEGDWYVNGRWRWAFWRTRQSVWRL